MQWDCGLRGEAGGLDAVADEPGDAGGEALQEPGVDALAVGGDLGAEALDLVEVLLEIPLKLLALGGPHALKLIAGALQRGAHQGPLHQRVRLALGEGEHAGLVEDDVQRDVVGGAGEPLGDGGHGGVVPLGEDGVGGDGLPALHRGPSHEDLDPSAADAGLEELLDA
jgi:hypothetical protein